MFGQNKKKFDSKVRFQNPKFKSRLFEQRNYKRVQRNIPQTKGEVFLSRLGLNTWFSKLTSLTVFLVLIYFVFVPNPFFIKSVSLKAGAGEVGESAKNYTNLFLKKYLPWPQGNIIFLSKSKLRNFLLEKDKTILSVDKIEKDFPSTLNIKVTLRQDKFIIETASSTYYTLSADGLVTQKISPNASGTLPSSLPLIKLNQGLRLADYSSPFKDVRFAFLSRIFDLSQDEPKAKIDSFSINNFDDPFMEALTKNGYIIKLDSSSNSDKVWHQLQALLGQLLPGDLKGLKYIDMRFAERAYVCYKNSSCAEDPNIINMHNSTSSEPSIK